LTCYCLQCSQGLVNIDREDYSKIKYLEVFSKQLLNYYPSSKHSGAGCTKLNAGGKETILFDMTFPSNTLTQDRSTHSLQASHTTLSYIAYGGI
jgi:hypothetical protein